MIVPMKKVYMVLQDKDVVPALERLRDFGAVHVEHIKKPESDEASVLSEALKTHAQAVSILSQIKTSYTMENGKDASAEDIVDCFNEVALLKEHIAKRQVLITEWEPWGDFDPKEIEDLAKQGVHVQFFEYQEGEKPDVPRDVAVRKISTQGKKIRNMAMSLKPIKLSVETVTLPHTGMSALIKQQQQDKEQIRKYEKLLEKYAGTIEKLRQSQQVLEEELSFHQAFAGRGEADALAYFKGFCPEDKCAALKGEAAKHEWAVLIADPEEGESVPTLLRNPKWVELINPVFDLINVLPGYKEVDISVIFLFFFSIFFGMLIGDAGYGLVFGLITLWAQIKMGKKVPDKTPFVLMYILSFMAIGWGALTGTYFGQKWVAPYIPALMPWLTDGANVQKVCFFLGALHLSLAHTWRGILRLPNAVALSEFGWALWIWGMFFLVRQLIVEVPMPGFGVFLMIGGAALAILFSAPNKNIFKAILGGLGAFAGSFINAFTDVISYIRLFAVGLATVAIADAFNDIALGIGFSNVFTGFATALILFIGHALNIVLAAMAILVHGLRLNVLEFSNHMGVQWAGIKFTPFKKNTH